MTINVMPLAAHHYIARIRNPQKKAYAVKFWDYQIGRLPQSPPREGLSAMGAQSVEIAIRRYFAQAQNA